MRFLHTLNLLLPLLFGLAVGSRPGKRWNGRPTQRLAFQNDPLCGRVQPWRIRSKSKRSKPKRRKPQVTSNRIVEGKVAEEYAHPFIAAIRDIAGYHRCGGSLITRRWVLTAAHCVEVNENYEIMLGGHEREGNGTAVLTSIKTVRHPYYRHYKNVHGDLNDLALLKLPRDIKVNEALPICLPKRMHTNSFENVTVLGWGLDEYEYGDFQDELTLVNIKTLPHKLCKRRLSRFTTNFNDKMICAGGQRKDACQADSGGPMAFKNIYNRERWTLKGTVAWGIGCGNYKPGVYMNVQRYLGWIARVTQPKQRREHPYNAFLQTLPKLRREQRRRITEIRRRYKDRQRNPQRNIQSRIRSRSGSSSKHDELAMDYYYSYFLKQDDNSNNNTSNGDFGSYRNPSNLTSY